MTHDEVLAINREVFAGWAEKLAAVTSTPLIAVGCAHGQRSGELHIMTRDDASLDGPMLRALLIRVIELLDADDRRRRDAHGRN